ncbi:hypothetical protein GCM10027290_18430 [Micromonospora sonneratiae]|uniref:Pyridoxamine 5'-phosphate oxidase n=1 Tax=Micromonospora sonneratiae TaxID=1184706 RepID=A0ABW3YB27_9ACTN
MPPFPIDRYLIPPGPPSPEGFTSVRQALTNGVPQRVEFEGLTNAVLVLPTGLARQWLEADPLAVVSTSEDDAVPRQPGAGRPPSLAQRAPLRLIVRRGTTVLASMPLATGLRRVCGPVEIVVHGWRLCAGTVRGPGDYGDYVELAWRHVNRATDVFGPPPVHRFVLRRKPPALRIESDLGRLRIEYWGLADKRYRRRWAR